MASERFQKLRVNTRARQPVTSPLSSLAASHKNTSLGSFDDGVAGDKVDRVAAQTALLGLDDLEPYTEPGSHVGSYGDVEDNDGVQEHDFGAYPSLSNSNLSSLSSSQRNRQTSITFDEQVILEDGHSIGLGRPLPRSESWLGPGDIVNSEEDREPLHHRVHSETEMTAYDRRTGMLIGGRKSREGQPYRRGEMRHPLLQTTVDELAQPSNGDLEGSNAREQHSGAVSSPNGRLLSPLREYAASPIDFSPAVSTEAWSLQRESFRSPSRRSDFSSFSSVGRPSRRRSNRSNSSMSPAHSFLGQFNVKADSKPAEPDAEGQEIGESRYIIGKQIGYGGFSVIKEVFTLEGSARIRRAVKIVRKQISNENQDENDRVQLEFEHEVSIWRYLHHPNILPLIEVHDSDFATFCITRLNEGGTLFDLIRSRRHLPKQQWGLSARLAKKYMFQLASALRYLHEDMHIVHRDIKLENCLLDMSSADAKEEGGNLLVCDFGFADFTHSDSRDDVGDHVVPAHRKFGPSETSTSVMGSINYVAPEVLNSSQPLYSTAVDMWAFGIVAYALLTGELPFTHEFQPRLLLMITRGDWNEQLLLDAPAIKAECDGPAAPELVRACLQVDRKARWDVSQVLACSWLEGCHELYGDQLDA